jgi:hypothetical protein
VVGAASLRVQRARAVGATLRVTVRVPGPGRVTILATGRAAGGAVTLGRSTRAASTAGLHTLVVRLSPQARRLSSTRKQPIAVTVTFTAARGGVAAGRTVRV